MLSNHPSFLPFLFLFSGSSGSLGETAVTSFIFRWVGEKVNPATRVLFYIGFHFSGEFQLREAGEMNHGEKNGPPFMVGRGKFSRGVIVV